MYFDTLHAALLMDGHGIYVWPAYLVSATVIALLLIAPVRRHKRTLVRLAGEMRRTPEPHRNRLTGEP